MIIKLVGISICMSVVLSADIFVNPLPSSARAIDNGGVKSAIDAYKDGIGAELMDKPGVATDNSAMNTLVFKYGEKAKLNSTTIKTEVLNSNTSQSDLTLSQNILIPSSITPFITKNITNPLVITSRNLTGTLVGYPYGRCNTGGQPTMYAGNNSSCGGALISNAACDSGFNHSVSYVQRNYVWMYMESCQAITPVYNCENGVLNTSTNLCEEDIETCNTGYQVDIINHICVKI